MCLAGVDKQRICRPAIVWLLLFVLVPSALAQHAKCLFVSSYHHGHAWSDGIERGLRQKLADKCELRQFDMDTTHKKSEQQMREAGLAAKRLIESWRPDVVIAADDDAAKYLIQPYFRDTDLPIVFCGINWTISEYGFPFHNVTGMIEVAPVKVMIEESIGLVPGASRTLFIGANTVTERKNAARIRKVAESHGLQFEAQFASSLASWLSAYTRGQGYDFVIIGSNAGIDDWDDRRALEAIRAVTRRLSVTSHEWMMPVTMLGMTKVPEEQGEWAAQVALQILDGAKPDSIPVIANRKWDLYLNPALIDAAGLELPEQLLSKGKVFQ